MQIPADPLPCCAMAKVTYILGDETKTVEGKDGETLLRIALDAGIDMENACGGNGFCTTCMCDVEKGMENLSELNDREENMGMTGEPDRLGCQAEVKGGEVTVRVVNA